MTKIKTEKLSLDRQKELIAINKVLAALVVILAFSAGYLLTEREEIVKQELVEEPSERLVKTLPLPEYKGIMVNPTKESQLVDLLKNARYDRDLQKDTLITKDSLLALVWAAQGQITEWGERTVPSYRSQFPLELYVLARQVEEISAGWYRFDAEKQQLIPTIDKQINVYNPDAAAILVAEKKVNAKTSERLLWAEAGAIAQNILLMSHQLHLGAAFYPEDVDNSAIVWQMAIGKPIKQ